MTQRSLDVSHWNFSSIYMPFTFRLALLTMLIIHIRQSIEMMKGVKYVGRLNGKSTTLIGEAISLHLYMYLEIPVHVCMHSIQSNIPTAVCLSVCLSVCCFMSRSRIFRSFRDVNIADEGLQRVQLEHSNCAQVH